MTLHLTTTSAVVSLDYNKRLWRYGEGVTEWVEFNVPNNISQIISATGVFPITHLDSMQRSCNQSKKSRDKTWT